MADRTSKRHQLLISLQIRTQKARVRERLERGSYLPRARLRYVWCEYTCVHMCIYMCVCMCVHVRACLHVQHASLIYRASQATEVDACYLFSLPEFPSLSLDSGFLSITIEIDNIHLEALCEDEVRVLMPNAWNRSPVYK